MARTVSAMGWGGGVEWSVECRDGERVIDSDEARRIRK